MSFCQPVFIRKNTPEFRKKLEVLGYKFSGTDHIELDCIVTFPDKNLYSIFAMHHFNIYDNSFKRTWKEYIDCGTNEELFLALAALRDDSDKNQYCIDSEGNWFMYNKTYIRLLSKSNVTWHKATKEEIVEHFKDK